MLRVALPEDSSNNNINGFAAKLFPLATINIPHMRYSSYFHLDVPLLPIRSATILE